MKEKSSFTTEKPIDYTASKDAYDGNRETASYQDDTSFPPVRHREQDNPGRE
ncbi:hypothetical protein C818_02652 [Lachnospiraceae bacterium MD308]|nr:hypothetical protein C818_02652 [Lachnospiraceae bacterium MD308]